MVQPASPLSTPVPWDLVSAAYAHEVVPMFEPYARAALSLAAPPAGSSILDVACGPGTLTVLAARDGFSVEAIDFSPSMIALLTARVAQLGLTNVAAHVADGQALPFPDATFAAAFSTFGLMFFPDRAKGFAELRRVLVPGGRAVVTTWQPLDKVPAIAAMFGALRASLGKLLGPNAPSSQEMPLTTEAACRAEMSAAFGEVEIHQVSNTERYPSAEAFWESIVRTMAPIAFMKKSFGDNWPAFDDAARTAIAREIGSGGAEVTMHAWASVGTAR